MWDFLSDSLRLRCVNSLHEAVITRICLSYFSESKTTLSDVRAISIWCQECRCLDVSPTLAGCQSDVDDYQSDVGWMSVRCHWLDIDPTWSRVVSWAVCHVAAVCWCYRYAQGPILLNRIKAFSPNCENVQIILKPAILQLQAARSSNLKFSGAKPFLKAMLTKNLCCMEAEWDKHMSYTPVMRARQNDMYAFFWRRCGQY